MENSQIEQPERFATEPEVDGDECPECGEMERCICDLCAEERGEDEPCDECGRLTCDCEFPDEDMRDEYDEEAGI